MPILVKDFTWTQTSKCIHIRVPISDVHREKVDLFTTDSYIKAHFSPFLFEVFLLHDVDNDKSKCIIKKDMIMLDLEKKEEREWECLGKELTKKEKMEMKEEIHRKCQEQAKQESEDRRIKKSQLDRYAVQQAMDLDTKLHNLMDSRRDHERNKAMSQLDEWTKGINNPRAIKSAGVTITELEDDADEIKDQPKDEVKVQKDESVRKKPKENEGNETNKEGNQKNERKQKEITKFTRVVKTPVKSEYVEKKKEELKKRVLPRLREMGEVEITHTPRTFPTPSRESTADEEQAWLKNITQARRATGFVSEDLRPEEQDPQWCKEKGDEFFRSGNFLGAISAYSHGITLSDKLPSLYANRSATHFALGNFNKCMNDCSTALELMRPACEANRRSRAKCIARRAAALARVGYLNKAIDEMKAAAKLLPDDETIKKDIYDMERAWEQNPDSD